MKTEEMKQEIRTGHRRSSTSLGVDEEGLRGGNIIHQNE